MYVVERVRQNLDFRRGWEGPLDDVLAVTLARAYQHVRVSAQPHVERLLQVSSVAIMTWEPCGGMNERRDGDSVILEAEGDVNRVNRGGVIMEDGG